MIKHKGLLSVLLVIIFLTATGCMLFFSYPEPVSAIQILPIFSFLPPTKPPVYLNTDWKYIDTTSGAGSFSEIGGLSVSNTNILAVGDIKGPKYEIHLFDGHTWKKHTVSFKPTGLEWSRTTGYLYASDNVNDAVWMTSNPMADSPIWLKIAGNGTAVGQFDGPYGMFATTSGALYVVDQNNRRLQYYSGGVWHEKSGPADCIALTDICITDRATYVTDTIKNKLYYQNPLSKTWNEVTDPLLSYPTYISNDTTGNLYIAATASNGDNYILKWTSLGFSKYVPTGTGPGYIGGEGPLLQEIDVNYHNKLFYSDNSVPRLIKETCRITDIGEIRINGIDLQLTGAQTINWTVEAETSSAVVQATPLCNYASVAGNGTYPLNFGVNVITLICIPEAGPSAEYTLNITRELSDNALLSEITIDSVPISGFVPNIFAYTGINVPFSETSVEIGALPQDPNAAVTGTGSIQLDVGENPMLILVMAQDEITVQQYILTINREADVPSATPSPSPTPGTSPSPTPASTQSPTATPAPTQSPTPTATPGMTSTPEPTATPEATPTPSETPVPSESAAPSSSPDPTAAPTQTIAPDDDDDEIAGPDIITPEDLLKKQFNKMWIIIGAAAVLIAGGGVFAGIMIGKKK